MKHIRSCMNILSCGFICPVQDTVLMAQCVTSDVLVLPIVLLVVFTPFSGSSDGLGPGCHLYRESTH